jgi:hypothetical protein
MAYAQFSAWSDLGWVDLFRIAHFWPDDLVFGGIDTTPDTGSGRRVSWSSPGTEARAIRGGESVPKDGSLDRVSQQGVNPAGLDL